METKHTPAPWRVVRKNRLFEIQNKDCAIVADVEVAYQFERNLFFNLPTAEANAKLIAAAPELLEALQRIIKESAYVHGFDDPCDCPKCQATKAIQKATEHPYS